MHGLLPLIVSRVAMIVSVGGRYLAVSRAFAWPTQARFPGLSSGQTAQTRTEISGSLISALLHGLPAGLLAWGSQNHGWTRTYSSVSAYPTWWIPLSVFVYLLLHD